jgi:hypothetical protein
MKTIIGVLAFGFVALATTGFAQSVPGLVNYQGQIQDTNGLPVPTSDYSLTFRIYDAAVGGTLIWGPQIFDGTIGPGHAARVPVVQGYFNVMLGPVDVVSRSLANAFEMSSRFIEVTVSNRPPIVPRQQLLSGPFALRAGNSDKLAGYDWGSLLSVNDPVNGLLDGSKLTPGTITPANLSPQMVLDSLIPPGTIVAYSGTNPPAGWFLCDGQQASRTIHSRLFAVIATSWGQGNGVTTFHLPDLRGMFLRGVNGARNDGYADPDRNSRTNVFAGGSGGNAIGTFQQDEIKSHTHLFSPFVGYQPNKNFSGSGYNPVSVDGNGWPAVTIQAAGGSESRPRNAYVNYIIKY